MKKYENIITLTVNQSPDSYRDWFEPIACPDCYREGEQKEQYECVALFYIIKMKTKLFYNIIKSLPLNF